MEQGQRYTGLAGRQNVYAAGTGPPLLLIHSINAAASAAEMRPLFDHYRKTHRVFAIDLPGYGLSERSDRAYSPRLMTDAVHDAASLIRTECGAAPFDALALSLSCEFLARAALERPGHYRSLALVSPTGFGKSRALRDSYATPRGYAFVYRLLRGPGWGKLLFRGLTRPKVIRYFLERTWGSSQIDEDLWRRDILTTRVPGAHYAPLYFLSARLFSADIHDVYERLKQPVWLSHGDKGDFTDYHRAAIFETKPNWRVSAYPTGALVYFEQLSKFCSDYDEFRSRA